MDPGNPEGVHLAVTLLQGYIFALRETVLIAAEDDLVIVGPFSENQPPAPALVFEQAMVVAAVPEPFEVHAVAAKEPFRTVEMTIGGQRKQKFIASPGAPLGKIMAASQFQTNMTDHRSLTTLRPMHGAGLITSS
jgi:hypothetical protein